MVVYVQTEVGNLMMCVFLPPILSFTSTVLSLSCLVSIDSLVNISTEETVPAF